MTSVQSQLTEVNGFDKILLHFVDLTHLEDVCMTLELKGESDHINTVCSLTEGNLALHTLGGNLKSISDFATFE